MRKNFYLILFFLFFTFSSFAQTVFKTRTGEKYHKAGCRYLKSIIVTNVSDALQEGLTACSVCRPPLEPASDGSDFQMASSSNSLGADNSTNNKPVRSQSIQCSGITKAGTRCKRWTKAANGRCYQHSNSL